MPFEEFDKKIREAADNHHPAYDEQAWKKMEKLLNKHLPQQKDDRRRLFFLFLLFLLVGGGVAVFMNLPPKRTEHVASSDKIDNPSAKQLTNSPSAESINDITKPGITQAETVTVYDPVKQGSILVHPPNNTNSKPVFNPGTGNNKNIGQGNESFRGIVDQKPTPGILKQTDSNPLIQNLKSVENSPVTNQTQTNTLITSNDLKITTEKKKPVSVEVEKQEPVITGPPAKSNSRNKKNSSFFFSLSLAPDVSTAEWKNPGKLKLLAGAGLGYTYKDKLTVRTGFYTGRKVYSASPDEYYPPASFWNYYPNLDKVDADCKVYEIPLSLSYHFGSSSKQNWFAGAGVSSYLMKRETYTYHYKDNSGQPASRNWTIRDENNHYFSVLTLSGGYQRKISNRFSVMAEPYLKLPLAGVGYGKVKLAGAGVMLSATMKPFGKK